ncbi:MAG: PD-(D/E)XK nuclease family protein [Bryobacteraceae bacterium]
MRLARAGRSRRFEHSWCENTATVVTPSPLLAAVAAQEFSAYQLNKGMDAWRRPAIYSINAYLAACWHEARYNAPDVPTLLSPYQERLLWQNVIEQQHPDLFDANAIAGMARKSAQLIAEWHIPAGGELWNDHPDGQQFRLWYKTFRRKCLDEGWITRSDLWQLLPKWISSGYCNPDPTTFRGFSTVTRALEQLKCSLGDRATTEPLAARSPGESVPMKSCVDFNQEIEQAARWARAMFEQQRSRSIGVFVPDLSTRHALVQRTFHQVFYPSTSLNSGCRDSSVFHVAAAVSLKNHPLIASALLLLELAHPRIHHADASAILRCPFIGGAAPERSARALADLRLRRLRELDISLDQMQWATQACPILTRVWSALRQVLRNGSEQQELPLWAGFIGDLLQALGWPGDAELTSQEQDVVEKWKAALSILASLGLVSRHLSYGTALAYLRRLLDATSADTGDWLSPVQILDAADASGLEFDCAFLTGLSDETWPPRLPLSPLVPLKLQSIHQVPGSSPTSAQRERERVTRALFSSAPVVTGTYCGRLSPAAHEFVKKATPELPGWEGKLACESYVPVSLEQVDDSKAPPYVATGETRGGTYIIKAQSLCPFRAFAEMRLHAERAEDACFGLDARERGGLLHKALQVIWQELRTQACLRSTPDDELRNLVAGAVSAAITGEQDSPFHEQNALAERERLQGLILEWLGLERNRKQPFTVETTEQKKSFEIAGLQLQLRIDRVDRLKNGRVVLIDYKSGKPMRNQLEGDRPAEPQLLVYAAALGNDVDGIFFGQLKPRELRGIGFSREKHFPDRTAEVKRDWDSFMQESRENVKRITRGFVEGFAAVAPIKGACNYCGIKPLCRVNESKQGEQEDQE